MAVLDASTPYSNVRPSQLVLYPPLTEEQDSSGAGRLLGHEDVDLFTILPAPPADGS